MGAHVDDQIKHPIQIAKEFMKNDKIPQEDYPKLYLLRLTGTIKELGKPDKDTDLGGNHASADEYKRLLREHFFKKVGDYPQDKFMIVTEWSDLTEDIIRTRDAWEVPGLVRSR